MEEHNSIEKSEKKENPDKKERATKMQELMMMMQSTEDSGIQLTEKQVDSVLENRCKITDYIHKDKERAHDRKMRQSFDNKYYFTGGAIVWLAIFIISMIYYKDQVLTILVATGTFFGGYGFGSSKKKDGDSDS